MCALPHFSSVRSAMSHNPTLIYRKGPAIISRCQAYQCSWCVNIGAGCSVLDGVCQQSRERPNAARELGRTSANGKLDAIPKPGRILRYFHTKQKVRSCRCFEWSLASRKVCTLIRPPVCQFWTNITILQADTSRTHFWEECSPLDSVLTIWYDEVTNGHSLLAEPRTANSWTVFMKGMEKNRQ
jgi:hypothetical protein